MVAAARALVLPVSAAALLFGGPADAQQRRCDLIDRGMNTRTEQVDVGGMAIINIHDPFLVRCTDGTELRANRGVLNQTTRQLQLWGDVFFEDPARTLTADEATYNSGMSRLYARGNVIFRNREEGSTLRGPELEYFAVTETRPLAQVHARQRPHLTLQPRERAEESEPLEIDADQVTILGQDQLSAVGSVVITRSDMRSTAREAQYNGATGRLVLRGGSTIASGEYDLAGEVIEARTDDGVLEHVHARIEASLAGKDLTVTAPDLQLFFENELLNRAVARTGAAAGDEDGAARDRAVATSRTFRIEADSIDALVPGQRVEQVVAIGAARGESIDTLAVRPSAERAMSGSGADAPLAAAGDGPPGVRPDDPGEIAVDQDWIRGDTLIGYFGTPAEAEGVQAPGDTAVVLERIVARGSALSLYRMEKQDAAADDRLAINFLAGEIIDLTFAGGELELATVDGLHKGIFLDPAPPEVPTGGTAPPGERG